MSAGIQQIKEEFQNTDLEQIHTLYERYGEDTRIGVQRIIETYKRKEQKLEDERKRLQVMQAYENKYASFSSICGIDEVGRGPLAGPVVAGAVILPKNCEILYLNDSKKLTAKRREELYEEIYDKAVAVGIGMADVETIDRINISQANYQAMKMAIGNLGVEPDLFLNDAVMIPGIFTKQISLIKGDTKSVSIAAASIIAKVTRDRMMVEYSKIYPEYGFENNKGYGSAYHIDAIKEYGPCELHRRSFIRNL